MAEKRTQRDVIIGDCRDVLPTARDSLGRFIKGTHWRPRKPHWGREWLYEKYVTLGKSTGELAIECGCSDVNIFYWLKRHGIRARSISEARALKHWGQFGADNPMHGRVGAANPNYVDGSSPERQRLYAQGNGRQFLRDALKRDGYRCRRCDAPKSKPKFLHVHHIKPWAGNDRERFNLSNVVTLCRPCHSWVHSKANSGGEFVA